MFTTTIGLYSSSTAIRVERQSNGVELKSNRSCNHVFTNTEAGAGPRDSAWGRLEMTGPSFVKLHERLQ